MEDLQTGRDDHGCGTINAQDGSGNKEVVVAGSNCGTSVEIYSIVDDTWRYGKSPVEIPKLDNVWVLVQLIHRLTWAKNQL